MKYPVLFALLTGLFWGMYGPTLGQARSYLHSPFKPYVAIGAAYLVWGVIGGLVGMVLRQEQFNFSGMGVGWGFIAGSLGAFGAFSLTLAMFTGGAAMPQVVMPLVFGGAVTVSALVSVFTVRSETPASPWLWVGVVGIGLSILLVAYNTPHAHPPKKPAVATEPVAGTPAAEPASN